MKGLCAQTENLGLVGAYKSLNARNALLLLFMAFFVAPRGAISAEEVSKEEEEEGEAHKYTDSSKKNWQYGVCLNSWS